jgi:hypothetical protein
MRNKVWNNGWPVVLAVIAYKVGLVWHPLSAIIISIAVRSLFDRFCMQNFGGKNEYQEYEDGRFSHLPLLLYI